ncbi:MAG: hypothetical protein HF976_11305 [ANME-2 cluster archaeon]|nr:hypothetical protein [ANME-2 cluster archaeon]MBC2701973.1 hypothetical protein [ANME-2 cluster archaeon]MBC2708964.1 hypothetical protein [ANME-2 cluster archaeon]MBC2745770.1 hypothetical protein [ANME-2 cluster archaeon]
MNSCGNRKEIIYDIIQTEYPLGSKTSGSSGPGDIPEYGSPSSGVVFCFLMLVTAGLVIRRRS